MVRIPIALAWAVLAALAGTLIVTFSPPLFDAAFNGGHPTWRVLPLSLKPAVFFAAIGFVSAYSRRTVQAASGGPTS